MSQPFNQRATCPAAGEIDTELGEFWLENPWEPTEHNLSAFERNRVLLNTTKGRFIDISHTTGGADLDSDSRSVVAGDFDEDGMLDLLIRNSGGGPVRLFRNQSPHSNWVKVSLKGDISNSKGIGARIRATVGELVVERTMQAQNCFLGQSPAEVMIGLNKNDQVDSLEILWPSGEVQQISKLQGNKHWLVIENQEQPVRYQDYPWSN